MALALAALDDLGFCASGMSRNAFLTQRAESPEFVNTHLIPTSRCQTPQSHFAVPSIADFQFLDGQVSNFSYYILS